MSTSSRQKIVVLTGAGISAESGLATFRDSNGLWNNHRIEDVCTPEAWRRDPQRVLDFYNERRAQAGEALPNAGHRALAQLEQAYDVVIITQNVDDLHERAGSSHIIHLHGELAWARGTSPRRLRHFLGTSPISLGQTCADGTQLRPDIVWFGEEVPRMGEAWREVVGADKVLVVGTSLQVYPAAGLVGDAPAHAECVLVTLEVERVPAGYRYLQGKAGDVLPGLVKSWLEAAAA